MQSTIKACVIAALLTTGIARADWDDREVEWHEGHGNDSLLVNVGDLFDGVLSLEFEHAFSRHFGVTAGLAFWAYHSVFLPSSTPTFTGISPEVGFRFHFLQRAPAGLWLGPTLSGGYLFSRSDGVVLNSFAWGIGADIGYTFVIGQHLGLELGIGGRFLDLGNGLLWQPRLRLGIGFVF